MSLDPASALRSASAPAPARRRGEPRRLLVAGAVGRLGESILNEALARGGYDEVVALSDGDATMNLGLRGLALAPVSGLPPLCDVVIAQTRDPLAPGVRSFHGRDAPFALVEPAATPRIAAAAAAAGVYLSLQMLMMPRSVPTLTSVQIARVAVDAFRDDEAGIRILGAAQIEARHGARGSVPA